ncbi:trifunctional purine biosynthetic protein adenosine-3 [Xenopus laevis]|uniref:phosphoribosylformylglycinamidine cyclo-ligase n=1 Tax=Xenopus laevis TaxID=8355 RepID=A0A8J1M706_XENLA|nr:trifunctional purine biosynthetic protein adenosine-3 [Xenopus laevis]
MSDKVLVVGGGTREQVLAQKLAQSTRVKQVLVAPGNAGTTNNEKITNSDVLISNPNILKQFCIDHNITLVVVSQFSLLAAGILDSLTAAGVRCFGPTAKAAQLEARKSFARDFMNQHHIPTAQGKSFTNPHDACSFITYADFPALVVKPCSSASGRKLRISSDKDGACRAVQQLTHDTWNIGIPMETFIVEERLEGVEFSCLAFTDGTSLASMPPVELQYHKRDVSQVSQGTEMQENYPEPLIARTRSQHSKVAQGLVTMCMNDILAQGANTLFFMPYIACGKLDSDIANSIKTGLSEACKTSGSRLLEREVANLPDVYPEGSYTLSGCAVGIVEQDHKLPKLDRMKAGDLIIGLRASGVHCCNTGLIGKIMKKCSLDYSSLLPVGRGEQTWGDMILNPSLAYSNMLLSIVQSGYIRAFAPITEGGLMRSFQQVLPQSLGVIVDALCWRIPTIYSWVYKEGALSEQEMVFNFNCGLGAVLIVQKSFAQQIVLQLQKQEEEAWLIGSLILHRPGYVS